MSYLPVTLACAGVIMVFGATLIGNNLHRKFGERKTALSEQNEKLIFERALVLVDLSASADETVKLIARIPGVGEVILLYMMDAVGSSGTAWITGRSVFSPHIRAKMRLVAQKNYLESLGTPSRALVELVGKNDIFGTFLGVASREEASLVVLHSQPMSKLRSVFMENITTRILRRCTMQDMLIYPANIAEKPMDVHAASLIKNIFTRVLCPIDFSSFSIETVEWAAQLDAVSEIVLVHVIAAHGTGQQALLLLAAEQKLAEIKNTIDRDDLEISVIVSKGDPANEIGRIAKEQNASLILMPRCGLTQVRGNKLGKTVTAVANNLSRPLLVRRSQIVLHGENPGAAPEVVPDERMTPPFFPNRRNHK